MQSLQTGSRPWQSEQHAALFPSQIQPLLLFIIHVFVVTICVVHYHIFLNSPFSRSCKHYIRQYPLLNLDTDHAYMITVSHKDIIVRLAVFYLVVIIFY